MKRIILVFGLIAIITSSHLAGQNNKIKLKITNIKETKGKLIVSIFDKDENFPVKGKEYRKIMLNVNSPEVELEIDDLPDKDIAIALFHDKNSDGECNRSFWGFPTEAYGFSNNAVPVLSAPSFDKVKFRISKIKNMTIRLIQGE